MPKLTREKITKANEKYGNQFASKYRAFSILQNQIEDVVKKSTQMWKLIYGFTTIKEGEEDPFEGRNNEEEDEDKEEETKIYIRFLKQDTLIFRVCDRPSAMADLNIDEIKDLANPDW